MISTAISLKEALSSIAGKFERLHPGAHVMLNGASSGELALQITNGAPVDVFVSASPLEMQMLTREKLLGSSPQVLTYNRLVVVSKKKAGPIKSMDDLKTIGKIAIGNPKSVPAGRYAEQALTSAHILTRLRDSNALIYGQNARALVTYIEQENVDAAMIYLTDSLSSKKLSAPFMVPKTLTEPITYEIARINRAEHKSLADQFIQFALTDSSKEDLVKHHFEKSWN